LRLTASEIDGRWVVRVSGELDAVSSPALRRQLLELVEDGTNRMVLELGALDLIDSSGLGVLVGVQKRLVQRGGELELHGLRPGPRRVFDITGLDQVFTLVD
jgi:anti-sigma B factor antagonist